MATERRNLPQSASNTRPGGQKILSSTRSLFLRVYESNGGNISAACAAVGINRRTIYRWLDSTTRVNRRFQKRIEQTRPADLLVDAAEQTIASTIASGDVPASIFTLKTKGKHRGWTEKPAEEDPLLIKVANAFRHWLSDFPDATVEERLIMLGRFASQGGVLRLELAKKLNIPIGK